jgi:hypothetical protein
MHLPNQALMGGNYPPSIRALGASASSQDVHYSRRWFSFASLFLQRTIARYRKMPIQYPTLDDPHQLNLKQIISVESVYSKGFSSFPMHGWKFLLHAIKEGTKLEMGIP